MGKEKNDKKKLILLTVYIAIIFILTLIGKFIVYPNICIYSINSNYDIEQYEKVSSYNEKLGILEKYLKNDNEKYKEIQYKVKLSEAILLIQNDDFYQALQKLQEIENKDTAVENKINDCNYELGKKYVEEEKYEEAIEHLIKVIDKEDVKGLKDKSYYNLAVKYLENKSYEEAINEITKVEDENYENLNETRKKINYEYGKYLLDSEKYNEAVEQLEMAKGYKDTKKYLNKAYMAKAENGLYKDDVSLDNLEQTIKIYKNVEDNTEYNGIKASNRKKQLNKAKSIVKVMGKKRATKCYIETRNVWKYDGRYDSWYIDKTDSYEYIETKLKLNSNGTFDITGNVYFYAFDNFSSLQEYCNAKLYSSSIEMKNIKQIPSTYKIDSNTQLSYSNGKFKLRYNKKENYSISFYNLYRSTVTY
jgi:hypothetical protein